MLKRFLVLGFALALFIIAFFVHQYWFDATQVDGKFRAERQKFHVDGQQLTSLTPPGPEPLTPTPPPLPVTPVPDAGAGASGPSIDSTIPVASPASVPAVPLDSNTLVQPQTPPAAPMDSTTPGTTPAPAAPPSPNSTMVYPGLHRLPMLLVSSSNIRGLRAQSTDAAPAAATPAPPIEAPRAADTNASSVPPVPAPAPKAEPASTMPPGTKAASVIILGYHQFSPPGVRAGGKMIYTMPQDVFEYEMKYLSDNHYNVVPLSDVVAFAKREKTLPPNTVAITIDDGYKSPLVFAAPILKKYGFPWTFFCYPSFIGNHPTSSYRGAASWPELVELQKEGVDIECHSMTHPQLTRRGGKTPDQYDAWLTDETLTSKQILEKQLGKTIKYFAYPYGEYNKEVEAKTIAAGYEAIFTVANNPIHPGTNVDAMGRYIITTPVEKAYVSYLRQGALGLADISPEPGSTVTDPRPVISAVLGYAGTINPASIIAEVRDMGEVRFDYDPKTSILRLYLPRDLIDASVVVNVRAKDAENGQTLTASWRFNYQPTAAGVMHAPIGTPGATNSAAPAPVNAPAATETNTTSLATPAPGTAAPAKAPETNAAPATTNTP